MHFQAIDNTRAASVRCLYSLDLCYGLSYLFCDRPGLHSWLQSTVFLWIYSSHMLFTAVRLWS